MNRYPHHGTHPLRAIVALLVALLLLFASSAVAAPDGSFTATEKAQIEAELARISTLLETPCATPQGTLATLEKRLQEFEELRIDYLATYRRQRDTVLELWRPFLPAAEFAAQRGEQAAADNPDPSVVDRYNALVDEAKELDLFTDVLPRDGARPGETINWVSYLDNAWEAWVKRGKPNPYTRDERYFFEGPEAMAGPVKASLGPLAQRREELRALQSDIHQDYRQAVRALKATLEGDIVAQNERLVGILDEDHTRLEAIRTREIPALLQEVAAQVNSGTYEHCYGIPPAQALVRIDQIPWVNLGARLAPVVELPPVPLPDVEQLPGSLPRVILKADGVEFYLRTMKLFADQAKADLEYSKLSVLNVVEGTWDVLSSTGAHIYHTGEFLVKAGLKVGDTALADIQALVNLGAYSVGVDNAVNWDPLGSVQRNEQWTVKLNSAIEGLGYDIGTVCANQPPEACAMATVLLPVMKPAMAGMERLVQAMPEINAKANRMVFALTTSEEDLAKAQTLWEYGRVRDRAAQIEQGAHELRELTGVITGEVVINVALGAGVARLAAKEGAVAGTEAQMRALVESYQRAGEQAQQAVTRVARAADKMDDITRAVARGDLSVAEAETQFTKLGEVLRANQTQYAGAAHTLPEEAQAALDKMMARGLDDLRTRAGVAVEEGTQLDDASSLFSQDDLAQLMQARNGVVDEVVEAASETARPVVDAEAVALLERAPSAPVAAPRPSSGERLNLSLEGLSGEYQLGGKLGKGGFKEVYALTDAAGNDTGKVLAFLDTSNPSGFKAFMGSELYSRKVLGEAEGLAHVVPEQIAQLPDGRWVMVMDNYAKQGISVGESLADQAFATKLRERFMGDPALQGEVERFAQSVGKQPTALSDGEFQQLAANMAAEADMQRHVDELLRMPGNAGKTRSQIIEEFDLHPIVETKAKNIAAATSETLGVSWEMPVEAQEAAFKYLIRSARQGVSQLDFKPGNFGFTQGKQGLELVQTDLGGAYAMSDDVARQFMDDLGVEWGQGAVREQQRMQAVLQQVVNTGSTQSNAMAIMHSKLNAMPLTPGAAGQTFTDNYFQALKRLAANPNADVTDLVGAELNQFVREEVARIGTSNPILDDIGHGVEPQTFTGHKGMDAVDPVPTEADEFLAAREPEHSPPPADVAEAQAARDALARAEEQKAAKQLDELGSEQRIRDGMCSQIQAQLLGGMSVDDLGDIAGRGFGCDLDLDKLLRVEPGKAPLPETQLPSDLPPEPQSALDPGRRWAANDSKWWYTGRAA